MMMFSMASPGLTNFKDTKKTMENVVKIRIAQSQVILRDKVVFPNPGSPFSKTLSPSRFSLFSVLMFLLVADFAPVNSLYEHVLTGLEGIGIFDSLLPLLLCS